MNIRNILRGLMIIKERSYSDLAKNLNVSENTVKAKFSRGIYAVEDLLDLCDSLGAELVIKDGENIYPISNEK